jgi:hypothetical protein
VLLVLQHICLYCSSATSRTSTDWSAIDDSDPITVGPSNRCRSVSMYETETTSEVSLLSPSAPPLPTISENEEEDVPLLDNPHSYDLYDTDDRDFEAGMAISDPSDDDGLGGKKSKKINCCEALLKQCLELIDAQASTVLASEDVEDLDISAVNWIVCRDTLCLKKGEIEVISALKRWSTRECKRQRLELTSENRRKVLEGAQYLVRFLTISKEDFKKDGFKSGLLTRGEADAVYSNLGANNHPVADLPDHLLQWQTIWKRPRKGRENSVAEKRKASRSFTSRNHLASGKRSSSSLSPMAQPLVPALPGNSVLNNLVLKSDGANMNVTNKEGKEKFNFIEEFFICLACIFD